MIGPTSGCKGTMSKAYRLAYIALGAECYDHFCGDCDPRKLTIRGHVTEVNEPDGWTLGGMKVCMNCGTKIDQALPPNYFTCRDCNGDTRHEVVHMCTARGFFGGAGI